MNAYLYEIRLPGLEKTGANDLSTAQALLELVQATAKDGEYAVITVNPEAIQ